MFNLGGYAVSAELSDSSALLALVALMQIKQAWVWDDYTDSDDIDAAVDLAICEIMTGAESVGDYTKIAEAVATADVASLTLDNFDSGAFHTYKLIIQGLKTNDTSNWVDHCAIELNDDDTAVHYSTFVRYEVLAQYQRYEYLGTLAYFKGMFFCSSAISNPAAIGHAELTFYDPQGDDYKSIRGESFVNNFASGVLINTTMQGLFLNEGEITKIRLFPVEGSQFLVNPASASRPSELRATLYGLR